MESDLPLLMFNQMLISASIVAAPILFCSLLIGLLISVLQVVTQIQEMTLTFVPKIIAAVFLVLVLEHWMLGVVEDFTRSVFKVASGF